MLLPRVLLLRLLRATALPQSFTDGIVQGVPPARNDAVSFVLACAFSTGQSRTRRIEVVLSILPGSLFARFVTDAALSR